MAEPGDAPRRGDTVPVAPSLGPALDAVGIHRRLQAVAPRIVVICAMSIVVGMAAGFVARALTLLIGFITNLCFYGRISSEFVSPANHVLGSWVVVVPVIGAVGVGLMARFGSPAIRGHGIPEAMEQILRNESRIPARLTLMKPLSAAISIGTGGPFGAEGPIIATGGALGSLLGQLVRVTPDERKTLLSAGAAAGMAATFGSPVSAVLLAIELLLFEYSARSLIPVAFAAVAATAVRTALVGSAAAFAAPHVAAPAAAAIFGYAVLGALAGALAVLVTRAVYSIEDLFDATPIHWMWWPAIGAVPVGLIGWIAPRTLGVGYDNIEAIIGGGFTLRAAATLCGLKLVSWMFSLGSGTSGGTLAPLFTVGGGFGLVAATALSALAPHAGIDPRLGALVGMAAVFAGASRAMLASVVFAFETTREANALLPILAGCAGAYLVSMLSMRHSIMTEKIARRGALVPSDWAADVLAQVSVGASCTRPAVALAWTRSLDDVRAWLESSGERWKHQAFPVVDGARVVGVVTQRELCRSSEAATVGELLERPAVTIAETASLREAADAMLAADVGRLPVVDPAGALIGILTRSDLLAAYRRRSGEFGLT